MSKYLIIPVYLLIILNAFSYFIKKTTLLESTLVSILIALLLIYDVLNQILTNQGENK